MFKIVTVLGLVIVLAALVATGGEEKTQPISDADFSLYPGSVFDVPAPAAFTENASQPGSNELIPAMFEGGPPQIPHGIQDYLPIEREENGCLNCHLVEKEEGEDAPLLPETHRIDLRAQPPEDTGATAGARWVCTACHVPLTTAKALPECAPQK